MMFVVSLYHGLYPHVQAEKFGWPVWLTSQTDVCNSIGKGERLKTIFGKL